MRQDEKTPTETDRRRRGEELEAKLTEFSAHLQAGMCEWLEMVAEFDRIEGWGGPGVHSCAAWLTWRCQIAPVTAREHVRIARKLEDLPLLTDAFRDGRLSYSQMRALTRCATADNQELLLHVARNSTAAQLTSIVRNYNRFQEVQRAEDARRRYAHRGLATTYDEDGFLVIKARLLPEDGALVLRALQLAESWNEPDASAEASPTEGPPSDGEIERASAEAPPRSTWAARRADALVAMAQATLEHGVPSNDERHHVVIHVNEGESEDSEPETYELEDGTPLHKDTADRLMCNSWCSYMKTRSGRSMDISYKTRRIPTRLRRALRTRDRECRWPGCHRKAMLDPHHVEWVTHDGKTRLDNLLHLCKRHHWCVHEGGFGVRVRDGTIEFLRRDGEVIEPDPPSPRGHPELIAITNEGKGIDRRTAESEWGGEECDSVYIAELVIEDNIRNGHLQPL